ncbi:MAG: hypothetical protein IPJ30_02115 [Acidobacteria bacterium]|nr:hypothetical protein [Acidobacteriota bacterium]
MNRPDFRGIIISISAVLLCSLLLAAPVVPQGERDLTKPDTKATPATRPGATPTPVPAIKPSETTVAATKKICATRPETVGGTLTPEAFSDRLVTYFQSETEVQIVSLENTGDIEQARRRATSLGCEYLIRTIIKGDQKGANIKLISKKKYKISVEYFLEQLSDNRILRSEKLEEADKNDETAVGNVIGKLASGVFSALGVGRNPRQSSETVSSPNFTQDVISEPMIAPRLVVQTSHASSVSDFVYSPDGKLLATLGADGVVKIWLVYSKLEVLTIPGFDVVGIDFHPNGRQIACVSKNSVVRIFDVGTGNLARRFSVPIEFSPSGNLLVVGKIGGVKILDVATGRTSTVFKNKDDDEPIESLKISPDGKSVAAVVLKNKVKIWSLLTLKEIKEFDANVEEVTAISFSRDSSRIAVGSVNGSVKTYFASNGKGDKRIVDSNLDKEFVVKKIGGIVGKFVPYIDSAIRLKNLIDYFTRIYKDESIRAVDFSPDGKSLAYQSGDNSVKVVNLENGAELFGVQTENTQIFREGNALTKFFISRYFKQICPVKFNNDGSSLNTCREFKNIQRWDAKTGKSLETLAVARRGAAAKLPFPVPFAVSSAAYFLNDKTLVTTTLGGGVALWNLESGAEPEKLLDENGLINVPISPDGKLFTKIIDDGKAVGVFEVESKKQVSGQPYEKVKIFSATFSPDGRYLAVQLFEEKEKKKDDEKDETKDGKKKKDDKKKDDQTEKKNTVKYRTQRVIVSVFDIAAGSEIRRFENVSPNQFAFSPDGKNIAVMPNGQSLFDSFSNKSAIKMFDIVSGDLVHKTNIRTTSLGEFGSKIVFSSDGKVFVAEDSGMLKVWETATGKKLQEKRLDDFQTPFNLTFVPQKNVVTFTTFKGIFNWEIDANQVTRLPITTEYWGKISYSPERKGTGHRQHGEPRQIVRNAGFHRGGKPDFTDSTGLADGFSRRSIRRGSIGGHHGGSLGNAR